MKEIKPGQRVVIRHYKVRPSFWNHAGEMDSYMGQTLTVAHVSSDQEVWHAVECQWVFRLADIERFVDGSADPNLAFRMKKGQKNYEIY